MKKQLWMQLSGICVSALILCGCCCKVPQEKLAASFNVNKIYTSHMVLQREKPVVFAGTAEKGMVVKVCFAGKCRHATADAKGLWRAEFPAMKAGGPYALEVSGKNSAGVIRMDDILIGEVWVCSGQSNMQMPVNGNIFWRVKNYEKEVADANHPNIRLYRSATVVSPGYVKNQIAGSGWQVCSPKTISPFSAAGYFFGRQLQKDLNVPVGLIQSAWGGTKIEPWIPEFEYQAGKRTKELQQIQAFRSPDAQAVIAKANADSKAKYDKDIAAWMQKFNSCNPAAVKKAAAWRTADFNDQKWAKAKLPGDLTEIGMYCYRYTLDLPAEWAGKDLQLALGAVDDCDETYFNGVKIGGIDAAKANYWMLKRDYKIPGKLVKAGKNVIAVRCANLFGAGGIMNAAPELFLAGTKTKLSLAQGWKVKKEFSVNVKKIGTRPEPVVPDSVKSFKSPQFPSTLYNSMIYPWIDFPIRGVIWYQGCSNAGNLDYYPLHKLLISGWRKAWKTPGMPFVIVQLSGFETHRPKNRLADDYWVKKAFPNHVSYALTREIQAEMLNLANTGLAVSIDIGDHSDIHPGNKQEVGYRLAMEAERIAYGRKGITQGPKFKSFKAEGNSVRVSFDNVGKGLCTKDGKAPGAFAIAGKSGKFVWADARIDGDTVVVSSQRVKNPVAVRYAWTQYRGDINLANKDGFAAMPFRSDKPEYK